MIKHLVKRIPLIGPLIRYAYWKCMRRLKSFPGSDNYWIERYESGGTSGPGSYDKLAEFKAKILNDFVIQNEVETIIEYGCGDGNQLRLAEYPSYVGFDISNKALGICRDVFRNDPTKTIKHVDEYKGEKADLALSLDVIYHLVEDVVFLDYMSRLFDSSSRFVIIYSSNTSDNLDIQAPHVRHRRFSDWVKKNRPDWKLIRHIPNTYPFNDRTQSGSFADFYIYERRDNSLSRQ